MSPSNRVAQLLPHALESFFFALYGLESREYGRGDPSRWSRGTLYPQRLVPTSPTSGGRSVGIVRSRTQATEFFLYDSQGYSGGISTRLHAKKLYDYRN
jgi:hypothetical protein